MVISNVRPTDLTASREHNSASPDIVRARVVSESVVPASPTRRPARPSDAVRRRRLAAIDAVFDQWPEERWEVL